MKKKNTRTSTVCGTIQTHRSAVIAVHATFCCALLRRFVGAPTVHGTRSSSYAEGPAKTAAVLPATKFSIYRSIECSALFFQIMNDFILTQLYLSLPPMLDFTSFY